MKILTAIVKALGIVLAFVFVALLVTVKCVLSILTSAMRVSAARKAG